MHKVLYTSNLENPVIIQDTQNLRRVLTRGYEKPETQENVSYVS